MRVSKSGLGASPVAAIVVAASEIKVRNLSTGIWPAPGLKGTFAFRKSDDLIILTVSPDITVSDS
jgi:hypothetical protein